MKEIYLQTDVINLDLGYLVNVGYTDSMGSNQDSDNQFAIKVLIQVSIV